MIRFQCIHCGGRIAVPGGRTDRLAVCPECGGVTHPLAQHLAPAATSSKSSKSSKASDSSRCDNCGEPLGKLQKPFEWDNHFVCGPCHRMLSLDKKGPTPEPVQVVVASRSDKPIPTDALARLTPGFVGGDRKQKPLPSEFALIVRTACIGLAVTAAALYLIVSILQSLGYLFIWAAGAAVVVAVIFWIRKGIIAIRRRGRIRNTGGM
jgi:DNA-directed RNA polymerase subunit RPC12/RpoP